MARVIKRSGTENAPKVKMESPRSTYGRKFVEEVEGSRDRRTPELRPKGAACVMGPLKDAGGDDFVT